ncbi:serine/threonine-protein kinase [Calothrix sp. PCC 7507]|uniref:serine/threonine-protein kinase n=1 Tax=Calothrix sp. PCC 7507 TaxID=99598 RepID=UPI00029F2B04|nr:serine/threonine-protein kinase [Calothrix sp. PCC 7507]AFY32327.1 serine/threonine protein kinase [Calothrix sp. PCC 7507]
MTTTLLNNRYQVIQVLGAGGFGETFLAEDTHMPSRRRCVIKQLKPVTNDPQTYQMIQQRFEREAATLEYLGKSSDQIPELYAYFSENGQFYLVQEWIHGETLREVVQAKGYETETTVRGMLLSLLSVLDYIHSKGIIHRDIKPDNIILRSSDSKPVLIDFGAVKETIRSVVSSAKYPTQSMVIGTPGYMPSEQALGRPVYATDIYSLGVTAIYLLTGKSPHELQTNQQTGEILWQDYAPQVSHNLAQVLNQAMKPLAGDRYTTASKMLYALQSSNHSSPHTVTLPPTIAKPTRQTEVLSSQPQIPANNWQKPAVVIGSVLIGSLFGAVAISSMTRQQQPEVPIAENSVPSPESLATNPTPLDTPVPSLPSPTPDTRTLPNLRVVPAPKVDPNPVIASTPQPENQPIPTETPTSPLASTPPPETASQPTPTPTPEIPPTPQNQPRKLATNRQSVPAFPTGTARNSVEATLGKPKKDLRGLWPNTRAITYRVVPNQIDLGYLFDRNSGTLRQTEASFASSVDQQVMQTTLDGMLGGQATAEIKQGLQQVQQRQSDNFQFTKGRVKGQIVRQNCDFIYISIWDADLHDFVNPSDAKQC